MATQKLKLIAHKKICLQNVFHKIYLSQIKDYKTLCETPWMLKNEPRTKKQYIHIQI